MEVHFTPEQEIQMAQIAAQAGTDPELLVKDEVLRLIEEQQPTQTPVPELPVWQLGAVGTLRRCDLYDDVG